MIDLAKLIQTKATEINQWLAEHETIKLPLYSSCDIRDSGFKCVAVDSNLFPAGFNNLCLLDRTHIAQVMQNAILERLPLCGRILLICEEHTRNTWYLENLLALRKMLEIAKFDVTVATFFTLEPMIHEPIVTLETASKASIQVHNMRHLVPDHTALKNHYDMILLNNDLSIGIPDFLHHAPIPIFPSMCAGWHSRFKSQHFRFANQLIESLSTKIGGDPWLMSGLFDVASHIDINEAEDRIRLADTANALLKKIQAKYAEYKINQKPFIFLKSDYGTYGMGVMPIEDPKEILALNRKDRNKLHKGKQSRPITQLLLQEGIPSIQRVQNQVAEICMYQIASEYAGAFYRVNTEKTDRQNLNSTGMSFQQICNPSDEPRLGLYELLARIAAISASKEIEALEKNCD